MNIYCDLCDYSRDVDGEFPPRTCPHCGSLDLRFEQDQDWNQICALWAMGHGWTGQPDSSLPQWYYREKKLVEWKNLKELLTDPKRINPLDLFSVKKGAVIGHRLIKFWLDKTHLIQTWKQALETLAQVMGMEVYKPPPAEDVLWESYPMIRKLGKAYLAYWEKREPWLGVMTGPEEVVH